MDQEILDARAKLAARFGNSQIGGKGMLTFNYSHQASSQLRLFAGISIIFIQVANNDL